MITKRQKEVWDFVKSYTSKNGYSPTLDEIKDNFKFASVSTAYHHIQKLIGAGYVNKESNQPRAVATLEENNSESINVPLLGTIAAGQPIEAIETGGEIITVSRAEVSSNSRLYALRVVGNSMIDEGIFDGDIVVIRKQETADNGQTVVAIIDKNEATLKKFYREQDCIRLQPANPTLFPIYREEVEIRGIVVKIIRRVEYPLERESAKNSKYQRKVDYSWDFRGEKTKSYTHGLHTYPAMFIPQVANRLLQKYSKEGDMVCDIFCGSGTALVESRVLRRNAVGIDLNPLAIFLADVKTTEIDPRLLQAEYFALLDRISQIKDTEVIKPEFNNLDFWFNEKVIIKLAKIKKAIREIKDKKIQNFFMVGFSEIVRFSSNTKNGEFKLVRIKKEKLDNHDPDVLRFFKKKTESNIVGMKSYFENVDNSTKVKIIFGDSSKDNGIKENSIDCIITSPPYGDSRTTVAYGQFSRLSAQWIDIFDNPNEASGVDNELLGGQNIKQLDNPLKSKYLSDALLRIAAKDEKRAREVLSFNIGLNDCMKQAYKILKKNSYFCLVIGNRQVKQVRIPTDFIIAEMGENLGFVCEDIIVRNIPGKRMPAKNSPTNVSGELEETMNKESIVVLRKD